MLRYRRPPGYRRAQPVSASEAGRLSRGSLISSSARISPGRRSNGTRPSASASARAEYGFTGGDTIVKAYVRAQRLGGQEMFVPLAHPPGDAQADFGEALVVIAGVECIGARPGRRSPAQRRRVCAGVSGRDDGGVLQDRAHRRVRLLRWRAAAHRLRPHEAGGGADAGTARASGRRSSANSNRTMYSPIASGGRGRATTKARWKGWSGTSAATSSCRSPVRQLGRVERRLSAKCENVAGAGYGGTRRRSGSASPATAIGAVAVTAGPV